MSVEGATEEVARAHQRESHDGEQPDRRFWWILEMSENAGNQREASHRRKGREVNRAGRL